MSDNYLGNPNLKKTNVQQEFTAEQIEEYVKCSKDPSYFIEKYVKIINLDEGLNSSIKWRASVKNEVEARKRSLGVS